jgi:retron-type reverse transcriptase
MPAAPARARWRRCSAPARTRGRYEWHAQIDVRGYFASINHTVLLDLLARQFKNRGLMLLLTGIIRAHEDAPGRGLPIGTLTSQHFANFYLGGLDRPIRGANPAPDTAVMNFRRQGAPIPLRPTWAVIRHTFGPS